MKVLLLSIFIFSIGVFANAQPGTTLITGTVTEKENVELTIYKTVDGKPSQLSGYKVSRSNPDFAFVIPQETGATYKLMVSVMKQGPMRLEVDKRFNFPLQVLAGQNLFVKITPSALNEAKKKGIEIKTNSQNPELSYVTGNVVNSIYGGEISLAKVVNGGLTTVASFTTTQTNKRFQLAIPVKQEGFYYVTSVRVRLRVYLKPADHLEMNLNTLAGEYDLVSGSEENQLLDKWQKLFLPATKYGYCLNMFQSDTTNLENYITNYQRLQPAIQDFKSQSKLSNNYFNKLFGLAIDLDNEYAPMNLFSNLCRRVYSKKEAAYNMNNVPAFYKQFIQPGKFKTAEILKIGEAISYVNLYQKFNLALLPQADRNKLSKAEQIKFMINSIANDTLKSFFLKNLIDVTEINNLSEFRSTFLPFEKYAFMPEVKQKYMSSYNTYLPDTAYLGKSSYNFSLPDSTGRMVSMQDFRGKVVLIDVWATWCGPCRGQFPYLKDIEEDYKDNKGIVFVGISLDRETDKQKWMNMIQKEELHGIHLLDDRGKAFAKKYDVMAVPRFMLINKKGEWVEVRCPLPEAKQQLKKYIDEALNQDVSIKN